MAYIAMAYIAIAFIRLISMTRFKSKAMPITDNNYSYHIKAVALVQPIIWSPYHTTSY